MSNPIFMTKNKTVDTAAGLVVVTKDIQGTKTRTLPASGEPKENLSLLFSENNPDLVSFVNSRIPSPEILATKRDKTDRSWEIIWQAPTLNNIIPQVTLTSESLSATYKIKSETATYVSATVPGSTDTTCVLNIVLPQPSTGTWPYQINATKDRQVNFALTSEVSSGTVKDFEPVGGTYADVRSGTADLSDMFSTSNTILEASIKSITPPATALKPSTEEYGDYVLNEGAANPWDTKLDSNTLASEWTARSYNTGDFCSYLGKTYLANQSTSSTDIPGDSNKWTLTTIATLFSKNNPSLMGEIDNSPGSAITGNTITLSSRKTSTADWSIYTSTKTSLVINFESVPTNQMRYCELLITGVVSGMIDLVVPTGYVFKSSDDSALKPEAGDNLITFAEYAENSFIVSREVLVTVTP